MLYINTSYVILLCTVFVQYAKLEKLFKNVFTYMYLCNIIALSNNTAVTEEIKMKIKREYKQEIKEMTYILDFDSKQSLGMTTDDMNKITLDEFYKAVDWLFSKGFDEYVELESNTINPVQQHIFTPLRVYKVLKNGHYKTFRLFTRAFGGICITES